MARVFWVTGLSGSGKTTLAAKLVRYLREKGQPVFFLDSDSMREMLGVSYPIFEDNRQQMAYLYARTAKTIASQGCVVVVATMSLIHEVQEWNRKNIPQYIEVYIKNSLDTLRKRDPKGIYKHYDAGNINEIVGLDIAAEFPKAPDILLENDRLTADQAFLVMMQYLKDIK